LTTIISVNGKLGGPETAVIPVLDRGFLYGDSVYEVVRTYAGRPFALEPHLDRLQRSADLLGIVLPVPRVALVEEIDAALARAGNRESYVRVIVTRGSGPIGLDPALASEPCRVIIVTELKELPAELYRDGASIVLVPVGRTGGGGVPAGAKSGNYLVNIMALAAARKRGAHEAVMVDGAGYLTEGTSSNVFALREGALCTPPLSAGILQGITRGKVMELGRQAGLRMVETELRPADLTGAEEVFLTSTLREVLPITRIDEQPLGDGRPGPVTRKLAALYRGMTGR
jgi:branched-chain amino acid aminotransferase